MNPTNVYFYTDTIDEDGVCVFQSKTASLQAASLVNKNLPFAPLGTCSPIFTSQIAADKWLALEHGVGLEDVVRHYASEQGVKTLTHKNIEIIFDDFLFSTDGDEELEAFLEKFNEKYPCFALLKSGHGKDWHIIDEYPTQYFQPEWLPCNHSWSDERYIISQNGQFRELLLDKSVSIEDYSQEYALIDTVTGEVIVRDYKDSYWTYDNYRYIVGIVTYNPAWYE